MSRFYMIIAGYWKKPVTSNKVFQSWYQTYSICMQAGYPVFDLLLIVELIRLIVQKYDPPIVISSMGVAVNATKITVKILIFNNNNILDLYGLIERYEQEIWTCTSMKLKQAYGGHIKRCERMMLSLLTTTILSVAFLDILGVLRDIQLIQHSNKSNVTMESHNLYQFYFPGKKLDHLVWTYAINSFATFDSIMYNTVTHTIVTTLFAFSAAQMNILGMQIGDLQFKNMDPRERASILQKLCKKHDELICFVKRLNEKTKIVLLMEFVLSSMDMSSVAVNIAKKSSTIEVLLNLTFFSLLCTQLYILTSTADNIKFQSELIAEKIYETDWDELGKNGRFHVRFLIMRAQRPSTVKIGLFGPMTLSTAMTMMKFAYSYVSIMME
ncbi:odorant receptor 13a-like [Euwallacea fornicatus]|uniref:odorant receptor 13a-like n=1 Tax=Euwallacea fornicatus TaxID=995702 RepID=UPI00338DAE99